MATGMTAHCRSDRKRRQCTGKRLSRASWSSFNKEGMSRVRSRGFSSVFFVVKWLPGALNRRVGEGLGKSWGWGRVGVGFGRGWGRVGEGLPSYTSKNNRLKTPLMFLRGCRTCMTVRSLVRPRGETMYWQANVNPPLPVTPPF